MNRRSFLAATAATLVAASLPPVAADAADALSMTGAAVPALAGFDELMRSFMTQHDVPGGALAVARHGRIVYARGFGFADVAASRPVEPNALFRIASLSKPFTAAAILQLQERGKLHLDESAFKLLDLSPILEVGKQIDPRLWAIRIRHLLNHTGGFDRGASFDPMFRSIEIAKATNAPPPALANDIVRYMMGRPLDFDPGTREVYSNFGYCVLGRVIEKLSGQSYESHVKKEILAPLNIHRMRIGKSLEAGRAADEVHYYPRDDRQVPSVFPGEKPVPPCDGGWCIEAMDSHGGWIASAPALVQFAASFDDREHCKILKAASIAEMFSRPAKIGYDKDGHPLPLYYACGWDVRPVNGERVNTWHSGLLDGSATLLVRRHDGLSWAIVFNRDYAKDGTYLMTLMDPPVHAVADGVKAWPEGKEFDEG